MRSIELNTIEYKDEFHWSMHVVMIISKIWYACIVLPLSDNS